MVERKRNGYSDREIMRLSGHKRITSLEHYDPGNSLEIKSKMASALMLVPKSSTNSTDRAGKSTSESINNEIECVDPFSIDTDSCLNSGEENCVDPLSINTESCLNNEDENKQLSQVMIEYEDNEIICAELNKPIENIAASNLSLNAQYLEKRRLDLEQQKLNIIEAQNKQIMKINSFLLDKFEKSL